MVKVSNKFGVHTVSFDATNGPCREAIKIERYSFNGDRPLLPLHPDEEIRVMRLLLYDLKMGYTKLEEL